MFFFDFVTIAESNFQWGKDRKNDNKTKKILYFTSRKYRGRLLRYSWQVFVTIWLQMLK